MMMMISHVHKSEGDKGSVGWSCCSPGYYVYIHDSNIFAYPYQGCFMIASHIYIYIYTYDIIQVAYP